MLQIISFVSVFFVVVSILSFCLKTHPDLRVPVIANETQQLAGNLTVWKLVRRPTEPHESFFYMEAVCNSWFAFEILVRLIVRCSIIVTIVSGGP